MADVITGAQPSIVLDDDHHHPHWDRKVDNAELFTYLASQRSQADNLDLARDINKTHGESLLAIERNGGDTRLLIERTHAHSLLETQKMGSHLHEQITEKTNKLETLIRQLDTDNAKAALMAAKAELLEIKYNGLPECASVGC